MDVETRYDGGVDCGDWRDEIMSEKGMFGSRKKKLKAHAFD